MKKKAGFTLIEMLIVIAVIGIISVFMIFFIQIIKKTTDTSIQKSSKSIIINTMINRIREDLFTGDEITPDSTGISIKSGKETINYRIKDRILFRNEENLTGNETIFIESISASQEDSLFTVKLQLKEGKSVENLEIRVKTRR